MRANRFYPQRAIFLALAFFIFQNAGMSINFSLFKSQNNAKNSALLQRRQRAFVRKIIIVLCAGMMALLVVSTIIDSQETQVIAVAKHNIQQGSRVSVNDIAYVRVPKHKVFNQALSNNISANASIIATCEIRKGMPILQTLLSKIPRIPEGFTSITIHLASADHTLLPGEKIDLAFSKPVQDEEISNSKNAESHNNEKSKSSTIENNDKNKNQDIEENNISEIDEHYVSVVHNVTVMQITQSTQVSQNQQNTTTLAMPAADALRLLQAQSANPSLAIVAMKLSQ